MDQSLATVTAGGSITPAPEEWKVITNMARHLFDSGFLPETIKSPQAALAIILKGRELGIPPMQAFASINVIKGKPTLSAELMGALVFRAGHSLRVVETTNERAIVEIQRKNNAFIYRQTFSIKDAQQAGLTGNQNWQKYPAALLRARCISAACRAACPDVIMGMYTPEELDENTTFTEITPPAEMYSAPAPTVTVVDSDGVVVEPEQEREETARDIFDAPKPVNNGGFVNSPNPSPLATDKQVKYIYVTGRETGRKDEQVETLCREKFNGKKPNELTKNEASRLIEILRNPA